MTASAGSLVLLDTNIWLDYYLAGREGHAASFAIIDFMLCHEMAPLYAVSSIKDVFHIVRLGLKRAALSDPHCSGKLTSSQLISAREGAWACVDHMQSIATAVGADSSDVAYAIKQKGIHPDFEDDLVIAACCRADVDLLVTNDERFLRHCPVAALDARDALEWMEARV